MISFNTGITASNGAGGATLAVTIPAGVHAGDVILFVVSQFNTNAVQVITASSTGTAPVQVGSTVSTASFSALICNAALFYIVAGAGDAGKVITVGTASGTSASQFAVALGAWAGASNSAPIDVSGSATAAGASATITCPAETTGVAGDWDIQLVGAALGGATFTGGAGFTQREAISDGTSGATALIYDNNASVGGAGTSIGGAAFANAGHNNWWVGFTVGLAPVPAPAVVLQQQQQSGRSMLRKRLWFADL